MDEPIPRPAALLPSQRQELLSIVLLGCDLTTAEHYVGATAAAVRQAQREDAEFARQLQRAEASAELHHMRNVHAAAKDEKNWRTSVWWLERRAPERFGRRDPATLSRQELEQVVDDLAQIIVAEMPEVEERRRLVERLLALEVEPPGDGISPSSTAQEQTPGDLEDFENGDGASELDQQDGEE